MIIRRYLDQRIRRDPGRYSVLHADLISARSGLTTGQYLSWAVLISLIVGALSAVSGFMISPQIMGIISVIQVNAGITVRPEPLVFSLILAAVMMLAGGLVTYYIALRYPAIQKAGHATLIDLSLHNAVSYMYAMRRGGAEASDIFSSISGDPSIYGQVALEFRQVVRDTEYFGGDMITAIRTLSSTTPSEKLKNFLVDMLSVIESGGDLSAFLSSRVRIYQEEARFSQEQFLSSLQLVAEAYVTLFVAGPLFLIIVMVVMGMTGSASLLQLSAITYGLIPIGSLIFIIFVDMISFREDETSHFSRETELSEFPDAAVFRREGEGHLFVSMHRYDRLKGPGEFIRHPFEWFVTDSTRTLIFSVPLAMLFILFNILALPSGIDPDTLIEYLDDPLIIGVLIILIPYAFFYELRKVKVREIERNIPDFLDRLAGINRVGLTLAGAISVMVRSNLGLISSEIRRIKRDIDWGANVGEALVRFEERINTAAIARTVTLITKASYMNGDIGEVLSIASSDARMSQVLKRNRRSEMMIYTAIIYLAFFVFIFVVIVLKIQFLDVMQSIELPASGSLPGGLALTSGVPVESFSRLFFHTCIIQAFFSGLIAGQMGESSVRAGVKHAAIMIVIALVIFNSFL